MARCHAPGQSQKSLAEVPGYDDDQAVDVLDPKAQRAEFESSDADGLLVVESCHSTWLFDETDRRFCRIVKGVREGAPVMTVWRPYDRLVLADDSDAFVVFLDRTGTRLLRSTRHTAHCERCGGEVTSEMSLEDLRRLSKQ